MTPSRFTTATSCGLLPALFGSPSVADVISDWNTEVAPHRQSLKKVTSIFRPPLLCFSYNETRLHRPHELTSTYFAGLCALNRPNAATHVIKLRL
jgi:hypothetical protein